MSTTSKIVAGAVSAAGVLAFVAGPALAAGGPHVRYELDNGSAWTLTKTPANSVFTGVDNNYADAGVVVDLGETGSSFDGLTWGGSAPSANLWFGDGSEAYTPGTHPFATDPADFSYGFYTPDNTGGTVRMQSGPYEGQTLTAADIRADFSDDEVYAWIGVVYVGEGDVEGTVTSVNGQAIGKRVASVTSSDGQVSASVH